MFFIGQNFKHVHMTYSFLELMIFFIYVQFTSCDYRAVSKVIRQVCKIISVNVKYLIKLPNTINEMNEMVSNI